MNRIAVLSKQVQALTTGTGASARVAAAVTAAKEDSKRTLCLTPKTNNFLAEVDARNIDFESCRLSVQGKSSAIIIHGCALDDCKGVDAFVQKALDMPIMPNYVLGAAPREKVQGNTYTATYADWDVPLPPHTEMAYCIERPSALAFSCVKKGKYGQTFLVDTVGVLDEALQRPNLRRYFASGFVRVDRVFHHDYKWERYYGTKEEALAHMHKQGYRVTQDGDNIFVSFVMSHDYEKRDAEGNRCTGFLSNFEDGTVGPGYMERMMYEALGPAAKELNLDLDKFIGAGNRDFDDTGRDQGNAFTHTFLDADMCPLEVTPEDAEELTELIRKHMELVQWQEGDIVLVDNKRVMHGRLPRDPLYERDIRVALVGAYQVPTVASDGEIAKLPQGSIDRLLAGQGSDSKAIAASTPA